MRRPLLVVPHRATVRPVCPQGAGPAVHRPGDVGPYAPGTDGTTPHGYVPVTLKLVTEEAGPRGDGRDDVLVWRALGVLAGRPDVGWDDRVLGPADLGRLCPDYQCHRQAAGQRSWRRRGAHSGPAASPR